MKNAATEIKSKTAVIPNIVHLFDFEFKSNGYEFEAQEVTNCILAGKTQSDLWSWKDSLLLIEMMDSIRRECGIIYPKHDL